MVTIQDFRCYTIKQLLKILCVEFLLFLLAFILAYISSSYFWYIDAGYSSSTIIVAVFYSLSLIMCLYLFGLYNNYMNLYLQEQFLRAIAAIIVQFIIISNISYWVSDFDIGKQTWLYALNISYIFLLISRTVFSVITKSDSLKRKTIVLGASNKALQLKNNIDSKLESQTKIVGYVYKPGEREKLPRDSIIDISVNNHNDNELLIYCLANAISTIVVAVDDRRNNFPLSHLLACKQHGINILELSEFYEQEFGRIELDILDPSWVIYSKDTSSARYSQLNKVIFDRILACILLLIVSPLFLLVYILLKLNQGVVSNVIHSEVKIGKFSHKFNSYSFNCYNKLNKFSFVGKLVSFLKLKSLPILFNIIKGDLGFIGPQAVDVDTDKKLTKKIWYYKHRYSIKPGLLALGYDNVDYKTFLNEAGLINIALHQLQFDLFYCKNRTLLLDTLILLSKVIKFRDGQPLEKVSQGIG